MTRARPAGMTDVARLAGVSHQTVSRVLNDHPSVRPSTRDRVLAAMAELSYRPNRLARALVTARSGSIGVVTSGSARWGPMSALMAIEEAARTSGYAVHVRALGPGPRATGEDAEAPNEQSALSEAMESALVSFDTQAAEGVVVIAPRVSVVEALASISSRAPLLLVAAGVAPSERFDAVGVDQYGGARAATRHLLDLGHRHVGHLAGPANWFDALERRRGWRDELAAAGLPPGPVWEGDWTAERGYAVGHEIAENPDRPSALVVANDQMALGVLHALGDAGLDVPRDVSVTGFDDIEGTAHFRPPLTTVRQDFAALAALALARLTALIDGVPPVRTERSLAAELVVRASSGPAPGR